MTSPLVVVQAPKPERPRLNYAAILSLVTILVAVPLAISRPFWWLPLILVGLSFFGSITGISFGRKYHNGQLSVAIVALVLASLVLLPYAVGVLFVMVGVYRA